MATNREITEVTLEIIKRYNKDVEIEYKSPVFIHLRIGKTNLKFTGSDLEERCADYMLGYASGIMTGIEHMLQKK